MGHFKDNCGRFFLDFENMHWGPTTKYCNLDKTLKVIVVA